MVFSLERFRRFKPSPPFELGGLYDRQGETHILCDAVGSLEITSDTVDFSSLKSGDIIAVRVTAAEEFSVFCDKMIRHHQSQPSGLPLSRPHVTRFAAFVQRVRDFFLERGLYEIMTPTLVTCPGLEPSLEPLQTKINRGRHSRTVFLPTSPEISLKKALVEGWTEIFEIKSCFRDKEHSEHHECEFLMLEWYRAFDNLNLIEEDLRVLLSALAEDGWIQGGVPHLEVTDFATLFQNLLQFKLTPHTTRDQLQDLCRKLKIHFIESDTFNDLFHRLLIERIDPYLKGVGPTLVKRFPPSMAALAKYDHQGWTDRFEFYWRGLEIANAFNEVTDPNDQIERWDAEIEERKHLKSSEVPVDKSLIVALKKGMPPTGGIALGLERLYMAATGVSDIKDLKLFSSDDLFAVT